MKKIWKFCKNFILGAFILYGYNLVAVSFNMVIPINWITITSVSLLGAPALIALILLKVIAF